MSPFTMARTASAQVLAPTVPAQCGPMVVAPARTAPIDTSGISGVVVRITANASGRPLDAHLAKAISTRAAEQLQRLIDAPVRARFDVTEETRRDPRIEASSAVAEGRVLGVRWVIAGRVEQRNDSILVQWNVLDARSGQGLGQGATVDDLTHLERLSANVVQGVATRIGATPPKLDPRLVIPATRSASAFERYLAGAFDADTFNPEAQQRALTALSDAVVADPKLLPAWQALTEVRLHLVEWGEGGSARQRRVRSAEAQATAGRALAIAPYNIRSLTLLARVHLLRDEPIAAEQVIAAVERLAPGGVESILLRAELAGLRGDTPALRATLASAIQRAPRSAYLHFLRAEAERRGGSAVEACRTLNRVVDIDPTWAPAYAQRAVVRAALGDRRGGWADAEMASRLGQRAWGEMAGALIDYSVGDTIRVKGRLKQYPPPSPGVVLPFMDGLLRAAVYNALGQGDRARDILATVSCDDPRRRLLSSDPLLRFLRVPPDCRASDGRLLSSSSPPSAGTTY